MAQVQKINGNNKYQPKEKRFVEKTPGETEDVISELKSRIKKLEEDMAYAMAKK